MKNIYLVLAVVVILVIGVWFLGPWVGGCASTQQELVATSTTATVTGTGTATSSSTTTTITPGAWVPVGAPGIGRIYSIGIYNGNPYITCDDTGNPNGGLRIKKYNASANTWDSITGAGLPTVGDGAVSFYLYNDSSANGLPYVAYADYPSSHEVTVQKYSGGSWTVIGGAHFSHTYVWGISLYVYNDGSAAGIPYIAYYHNADPTDPEQFALLEIRKYNQNSNTWDSVGTSDFRVDSVTLNGLAALYVYDDGTPYIAYADLGQNRSIYGGGNGNITVEKFINGNWTSVGPTAFTWTSMLSSYTASVNVSLQVYKDKTSNIAVPFVSHVNGGKGVTVWEYQNNSWGKVGDTGFSGTNANSSTLFVYDDPAVGAVPYSASIGGSTQESWVMKYSSSAWESVGPAMPQGVLSTTWPYVYVYNGITYLASSSNLGGAGSVVQYIHP